MKMDEDLILSLLGRKPKQPLIDVRTDIEGSTVLVTGGGGSIGSELCVQLIAMQPKTLIIVEKDEFALYTIERRLKGKVTQVIPMLADVTNAARMSAIFETFSIDYVFHAAAYKHVPLVERNPAAGLENNALGTDNLSRIAYEFNVKKFLLVSTDKAVNPTNIMGASKRLAEYATLSHQHAGFSVVRFGNVIWSSGSVLPLFHKQLLDSKEITITHKDVTRYFMSISEAVMLMLQSMFMDGRIKVLDMGEQIRIEDMATRLATHMGIDKFKIKYIGLRDGEKLYEELTLGDKLHDTYHPDILIAEEAVVDRILIANHLTNIRSFCDTNDIGSIRAYLQEIVPGYNPVCGIVDDVWVQAQYKQLNYGYEVGDCFANVAT